MANNGLDDGVEALVDYVASNGGAAPCHAVSDNFPAWSKNHRRKIAQTAVGRGLLVKEGDRSSTIYMLPDHTSDQPRESKPSPKRKPASSDAPALGRHRSIIDLADRAEPVLKALQFSADVAQDALDAYLLSIANPEVVKPMIAARNQSRDALRAWCRQGMEVAHG